MCLAVPGLVLERYTEDDVPTAKVSFEGVVRRVCMACVPEAVPGDYVLVHVGFALSRIDAAEAQRVFELLRELTLEAEWEEPSA
jgi:hydrogenase expression/formation protein HypC